jgi:hypothetical protein
MNHSRLTRGLKIGWSLFCGIACVLLLVLWVRSYWHCDSMRRVADWSTKLVHTEVRSERGLIGFTIEDALYRLDLQAIEKGRWRLVSYPADEGMWLSLNSTPNPRFPTPTFRHRLVLPHWLLAFLITSVAAVPWIGQFRWRFSLRTLLIATTLVAVVLGLIVFATRQ